MEWVHEVPDFITSDFRTAERFSTKLIGTDRHVVTNVYDMFRRVTLPPKLVAHELKYYNQRLTGNPNVPDTYNYPTTE